MRVFPSLARVGFTVGDDLEHMSDALLESLEKLQAGGGLGAGEGRLLAPRCPSRHSRMPSRACEMWQNPCRRPARPAEEAGLKPVACSAIVPRFFLHLCEALHGPPHPLHLSLRTLTVNGIWSSTVQPCAALSGYPLEDD